MDNFIKNQILSFNNKKYNKKLLKKYSNLFLYIEIKNNKLININIKKYNLNRREDNIYYILNELLKYKKIKDTILLISLNNGYNWKYDIPIFNFAKPDGIKGLIFPNFDMLYFHFLNKNYNELKKNFNNYKPRVIINDIYFKGSKTTEKYSKIREKLGNENYPLNIDLNKSIKEKVYYSKKHKYLLDLPGIKPWSVRLKYLLLSKRLVIRISFYDSKYGKKSYSKKFYDFLFDNNDYIHLIYNFDYENEIPEKLYSKIKKDILQVYDYYNKNPDKYILKIKSLNEKIKKLNINLMYDYLEKLINNYTDNVIY